MVLCSNVYTLQEGAQGLPIAWLVGTPFAPRPCDAIALPASPGWHRRLRRQRSLWRQKIHRERTKSRPRLGLIRRLALELGKHHSAPIYKELMPRDKTPWTWQSNAHGWETGKKPKGPKQKGQGKGVESAGSAFPAYDSGAPSEYSTAASSKDKDMDLRAALSAMIAENKMTVPKGLETFFQPQLGEVIQSDQKLVNSKRKLLNKVDRLTKAMTRKKEQWQQFRLQMREHLAQEQSRYDSEIQDIQAAIDTAQAQLQQLMDGKDPEQNAKMEAKETVLEEMLDMDKPPTSTTAKTQETVNAEELRVARAHQQQMAKQLQELQQQVLYVTNAMLAPTVQSPSAQARANVSQAPFTPMKTRAVPPNGPYSKPEVEEPKNVDPALKRSLDIEEISD